MRLGRVIGTIWATRRTERMAGLPMQMVVPIDSALRDVGPPFAAVNTVGANEGDVIFFIEQYEACLPLPDELVPVDASIIGIVEQIGEAPL